MQYIKDLILGTLIYNTIFSVNNYYNKNTELSHILFALVHCVSTSIYSGYYLLSGNELSYYTMTLTSGCYCLFDFYYYPKYEKLNRKSLIYIFHHMISFYILQQNINKTIAIAFFMAEVSNIPNNLTYKAIKEGVKGKSLEMLKAIQLYSWILFRMVGLPIWILLVERDEYEKLNVEVRWMYYVLLGMSYYWGVGLIKKRMLVHNNNVSNNKFM